MRSTNGKLLAISSLWLIACGDAGLGAPDASGHTSEDVATSIFVVPEVGTALEEGFYALPFPNDLRRSTEGFVDLSGMPRPSALLEDYIGTIEATQRGFGLTSAIHLRFSNPLDPSSLPEDASAAQAEDASVYLVNLQADSELYGTKLPLETSFQEEGGDLIGDNWLGCVPYPGFIMEEGATYGLVVTRRVRSRAGVPVQAAEPFRAVMSETPASDARLLRAQAVYRPLVDYLDLEGGDERDDVVSAAVFTTQEATGLLGKIREVMYRETPEPELRDLRWVDNRRGYALYTGRFDAPLFQSGNYPYKSLDGGGDIALSDAGEPLIQGTSDLRVAMSIPTRMEMPAEGWPVVLFAHGTGGDYRSFERNGTAERLAAQGIAVIATDQVMHGDRLPGSDPELLFFNFQNPRASRGNVLQAALEEFQLVRLAKSIDILERHRFGRSIRFHPDKLFYFGHSQGSIVGVPFLAHEPEIKAAVLSGAGALLYLGLITKTEPVDITALVRLIIRDRVVDRFHPALSLLQAFFEPADAAIYGPLLVDRPPAGVSPKNILQTLGFDDSYTPVPTMEAMATAIGADHVGPELAPIEGLRLRQRMLLVPPVTGNALGATSVVLQYPAAADRDGHFVSFDVPAARKQSVLFFKTLAETGVATVVSP